MTNTAPFDELAAEYDAWFEHHDDIYHAEFAAVRSVLPASGRGMEIGVGTGRFAAPLGIPIGVEPSCPMAELARQRGIEVLEGVAESLPFADGSFDFAIMVTVVCFLDDVAKAFQEACRILKPQGTLIVGFIDRESPLGHQYSQQKMQSRFYRDANFYSVAELESLLNMAGFSNFAYRQALFPEEITCSVVQEGHGSGGFVVISAYKTMEGTPT